MASIKKRPDGMYRARYVGLDGKERAKHFPTRGKAQRWLDAETASLVRGDWIASERSEMRVDDWATAWLAGRVDLKPKTAAGYRSLWVTQIKPVWQSVPLYAIANADVAKWVAKMTTNGLSPSRVRQAFHLFSAMLADAVKDRRLASNPATGVRLPRMPRPEDRFLTHAELDALADACGLSATMVRVLGYCGIRFGEAVGLRVGRVDLLRARINIVEAATEVGGHVVFGVPKTHQQRKVPLPRFLRDEIAGACEGKGRDDFVFTAPRGGVVRSGPFRRDRWNPACVSVGLGEFTQSPTKRALRYSGLVPHDLRHVAASFAIASGATVKSVQAMLGHESATQTLDRYATLWGDELDTVAERMDAARNAEISRTRRGLTVVSPALASDADAV